MDAFDPECLPMPDLGALCRECGYPLIGLPEHRCPECGWQFTIDDLIPPGEFPPLRVNGQPVPATDAVRRVLDEEQLLFNENALRHVLGSQIMVGRATQNYLCVDRRYYFQAVHALMLADADGRLTDQRPYTRPPPPPPGPPWHCAKCGKNNPGNFDMCWNCMQARSA